MATETFSRTNGKGEIKNYSVQIGKDEEGKFLPILIEHLESDDFTGQQVKAQLKSVHIEADREGNYSITTEFYLDQYTPTGLLSPSFSRVITHKTKTVEAQGFFEALLPMTTPNIVNGYVAGGKFEGDGFLGHPNNRLFDASGVRRPDTEETTTQLPTFDYHNDNGEVV